MPAGDIDALREAIELTTCFWGGKSNPIIPTGDEEYCRDVIERHQVDALYLVRETESTTELANRWKHLPMPVWSGKLFFDSSEGPTPTLLSARKIFRAILDEQSRGKLVSEFVLTSPRWSPEDPLADVFLCTFGRYPDPNVTGFPFLERFEEQLTAKRIDLESDEDLPEDCLQWLTPLSLTEWDLEERYDSTDYFRQEGGVYIGDPNCVDDLIAYWNLRASGLSIIFVAKSMIARTELVALQNGRDIRDRGPGVHDFRDVPTIWSLGLFSKVESPWPKEIWTQATIYDEATLYCKFKQLSRYGEYFSSAILAIP